MDERVKNYLAEKRKEKCPDRVLENLRATLPQTTTTSLPTQYISWLATSVAVIALFLSVAQFWRSTPPVAELQSEQTENNEKTMREAYASIALVGHTLITAGQRSSQIVVEETLPSLKDGFENTKRAIQKTYESN